jgi:AbrB family looped-hinge helix DNA binding protein
MNVSIDHAGRIVLPKKLRDRFHLRAGSELEIVPVERGMELRPVKTGPSLKREGRLWVHQGVATEPLEAAVERLRNERSPEF